MTAVHDAEQMVAEVRDDPAARIRLAADTYALRDQRRPYRPYRRAVVAFMEWQLSRGVLNALDADAPGSPWWRAVNEGLLRDTLEAKLLVEREEGAPSRPSVKHWVDFFRAPSARSWYLAHNASVIGGYLEHRWLAAFETLAERFFMNVVLVRVLYAHMLVMDADLALGRLSFLARVFGHPRARGPQTLLALKNVLPDVYPIRDIEIGQIVTMESWLGRLMDFAVISTRTEELYTSSARALGEPGLLDLVQDGAPAYEWPADQREVWTPHGRRPPLAAVVGVLTGPRRIPSLIGS